MRLSKTNVGMVVERLMEMAGYDGGRIRYAAASGEWLCGAANRMQVEEGGPTECSECIVPVGTG